jgi:class 3 adenylate cyclase
MKETGNFNPSEYPKKGHSHRRTIECPILFFDVVGFSKDIDNDKAKKTVTGMQDVMWELLESDALEEDFFWAEKGKKGRNNNLVLIPTGDGYGIAIDSTISDKKILRIARELHAALTDRKISTRMGIAKGKNIITLDLNENVNIFGYGIVLATRVCDAAAAGQILVHSKFAQSLLEEKPIPELRPIKKSFRAKHGSELFCHNYHGSTRNGVFGKKI